MVKVSIVVPVYNSSKYLDRCLNSLVKQTLEDIEIIVINDGSTDISNVIIYNYVKNYPNKINVILNKDNRGTGYSRNRGLEIASGEYIGFVDSDDYVDLNYYEVMYNKGILENADIVRCDIDNEILRIFELYSRLRGNKNIPINTTDKIEYLNSEHNSCCNKIFRRDFIKDYMFSETNSYEDYIFTTPLIVKSRKVVHCDNIKYHYTANMNGKMMSNKLKINKGALDIFNANDTIALKVREYSDNQLIEENLREKFIINSYIRAVDTFFNPIDTLDKFLLIDYLVNLIDIKYGRIEDSRTYQLYRNLKRYKYLFDYIESITSKSIRKNEDEQIAKSRIKSILNRY